MQQLTTSWISNHSPLRERLQREEPAIYFRTLAILSEQHYLWDHLREARRCAAEGAPLLAALVQFDQGVPTEEDGAGDVITLAKEKLRLCLAHIQAEYYSRRKYDDCLYNLEIVSLSPRRLSLRATLRVTLRMALSTPTWANVIGN